MSDDTPVWTRDEIESPCVRLCVVHPEAKICTGCFRTIEEIGGWGSMTPEDRRTLMKELPSRESLLRKRRGGRAARMARR
ncbi:MAG: DUF1289 domain-containing protein [Pseudomonadota bacterium]